MTPQEFAAKWRGATLKERAAAQEHFIDLCRLIGHPTPAEADPAGEFFTFERGRREGVLHSRLHELWALRMGTYLGVGNDPRYTPSTTFETFPFPRPSDAQRGVIADAARTLDTLRGAWLNPPGSDEVDLRRRTLTSLYNERPMWLRLAHQRLDEAVCAAYGWEPGLSDEEVLERLLDLNQERDVAPGAPVVVATLAAEGE